MASNYTLALLKETAQRLNIPTSRKNKDQLYAEITEAVQRGIPAVQEIIASAPAESVEPELEPEQKVSMPIQIAAGYFSSGSPLTEQQQKYCRCILHVAAKQPDWCLKEKAWFKKRDGKTCVNPYAICTKTTKRTGNVECSANLDFSLLPDDELMAYGLLFYDQVIAVNGWSDLPKITSAKWRNVLEQGLQKWIKSKKATA